MINALITMASFIFGFVVTQFILMPLLAKHYPNNLITNPPRKPKYIARSGRFSLEIMPPISARHDFYIDEDGAKDNDFVLWGDISKQGGVRIHSLLLKNPSEEEKLDLAILVQEAEKLAMEQS